mgnify:CR=1 FL=1
MLQWLKRRVLAWADESQRREMARLQQESMRLQEEIERTIGKPVELSPEDRRLLTEKAKGIDQETLKKLSVLDP